MAKHIPFITSKETKQIAEGTFGDSDYVRLAAHQSPDLRLPGAKIWIDPAVDGLDEWAKKSSNPNAWTRYIKGLDHYDKIADSDFWQKPTTGKDDVQAFVNSVLTKCLAFDPHWITVPQLPLVEGSPRHRINRLLAAATGNWRTTARFSGRLILPLILTNQRLVKKKAARNQKVKQANACFVNARADGIWVIETDLKDDSGAGNMSDRIKWLIDFHEELNAAIPAGIRVAGPYWATNLLLWSRGLINFPAIGIGGGYQYMTPGGMVTNAIIKVAIAPLRRTTRLGGLQSWLDKAISRITPAHPACGEFTVLRNTLSNLSSREPAKRQVARFYKTWFDALAGTPAQGRALALFQDVSSAYALGKTLPQLDRKDSARKPHAVAEPLMMNCL